MLNRNQRCACLQERLPQTQKKKKEAKVLALRNRLRKSGRRACKSARFKNAKEAKVLALRNRLRKSGRRACKKCSTQRTRTHRKYCHTELVVPRSSGPPEYVYSKVRREETGSNWAIARVNPHQPKRLVKHLLKSYRSRLYMYTRFPSMSHKHGTPHAKRTAAPRTHFCSMTAACSRT